MSISKELVQSVRNGIAENPYMTVSRLAENLNAPEADVVTALPVTMRKKADLRQLESLWREMSAWSPVIVQYEKRVAASPRRGPCLLSGDLEGLASSGYGSALPSFSHIHPQALGSLWFVSNSLLSEGSHSVKMYDRQGAHILTLHLGRDDSGRVPAHSRAAFEAARARYGITPVPRLACCGGEHGAHACGGGANYSGGGCGGKCGCRTAGAGAKAS